MFTKFILTIMQTRNVDIVEFNIWHKSFDKCRNIFLKVIPQVNTSLWEQACLLVLLFCSFQECFNHLETSFLPAKGCKFWSKLDKPRSLSGNGMRATPISVLKVISKEEAIIINGVILKMELQNQGPVSYEVEHDKDPSFQGHKRWSRHLTFAALCRHMVLQWDD